MKQAGIPGFENIKAVVDGAVGSREPNASSYRQGSAGWGRQLDSMEAEKSAPGPQISSKTNAISNPAPLPLDPTLQSSKRRSQFQTWSSGGWRAGEKNTLARNSPQVSSHLKLSSDRPGNTQAGLEATSTLKPLAADRTASEEKSRQAIKTPQEKTKTHSSNIDFKLVDSTAGNNANLLNTINQGTTTQFDDVISSPGSKGKCGNSEEAGPATKTIDLMERTQHGKVEELPIESISLKQDASEHVSPDINSGVKTVPDPHRDKLDSEEHIESQKQASKPWWKFW
ncbi:hypothetical protein AA313_de0201706 [Arthrobotrys entomopaga]|nr:hypothetical protein AA313_de0201706 [Arthrobotrys entomopaga]